MKLKAILQRILFEAKNFQSLYLLVNDKANVASKDSIYSLKINGQATEQQIPLVLQDQAT